MQPTAQLGGHGPTFLASAFRDVDADSDLGKVLGCLRFVEGLPAFGAYKRRSIDVLRLSQGASVVDVGCGLGFDVARLAELVGPTGQAIGLDSSGKLLGAAERAFRQFDSVHWRLGNAEDLPFSSNSIDGVRVDRTLQHVKRPDKVVKEMHRVLRPDAWAVCAEPDWGTFIIDTEPTVTAEQVVAKWRNSFRNPYIGRQLLRRLRKVGFQNTWVEGFVLLADGLHAIDMVYDIRQTLNQLVEASDSQPNKLNEWYESLIMRDREIGITASVTLFLVGGKKIEPA